MRTSRVALILGFTLTTTACSARAYGPGAVGYRPQPPRAGTVIQAWDHYCVTPNQDFEKVLGLAGEAGFEMVGLAMTDSRLLICFKRPVIMQPSAPPAATPQVSPGAAGS